MHSLQSDNSIEQGHKHIASVSELERPCPNLHASLHWNTRSFVAIPVDARRASSPSAPQPRLITFIAVKMADEGESRVPCPDQLSAQDMASVLEEFLHRKSILEGLPGHEYSRLRNLYQALKAEMSANHVQGQAEGSGRST